MNGSNHTETTGDGGTGRLTNRRRVLQGLGALGLGSSVTGAVQAKGGNGNGNGSGEELPISTQLFTYGNSDLPVAGLIRESADAGYDAVEPYYLDDEDEIADALDETGIEMSSAHVGVGSLEDDFEDVSETYADFDVEALIHAYQGPNTFSNEDDIEEFAGRINDMADRLAEKDIEYGYHNHDHEFSQQIGDSTAYDVFVEYLDDGVHLQLDVGWALDGGENPVSVLNRYSDMIGSLHMKDMIKGGDDEITEIGEGDVNMKALANVARGAADIDRLIYEYDNAPNPIESMNIGAEFLERWNGPRDRSGK